MTCRPPWYFLRNSYTVVKPYGWLSYAALARELYELDGDAYIDVGPAEAAHWLIDLGVPMTVRQDDDGRDIPGVAFADIDAEINQRRRRATRRRAFRNLTRS